ncbi:prepilin-type N-terminal cleavage/methylation domain-containing protein [Roseateles sp. SL47]|uniref:pilus assembly FimT family protein n=1 Tax=Roseateles sp. SL47 TaxID=2995138 RepID=UPI00226D4960|nr:prepilin-type N-terminal cleavage/methylation domain-containing protein [Roseateles sp. SL47]WAC74260.1 prepilin-type N-terminal cleavage/methylation domain-containing protein [Roseateles sp. SL47]
MLTLRRSAHGLTLLELMVVVAIIAMAMALAMPGLRAWSANAQLRSTATSLQVAIRQAQGEAVRTFRQVVFFRTTATTCTGSEAASASGTRWVIKLLPRVSTDTASAPYCGSLTDNAPTIAVAGPTALCFNGQGRPTALDATTTGVGVACTTGNGSQVIYAFSSTTNTADLKKLQVWVTLGGSVRTCESTRALSDTVPDGCPTANLASTQ